MDEANNGWQQVEELHGVSSQDDVSEGTTFVNHKTMSQPEEVENTTLINQGTNTLQLVEDLHQQGDETNLTVLPPELTNKVIESSSKTTLEHYEAELTKPISLVDAKTVFGADEVETTTSIGLVTNNTLQLLDELNPQDDATGTSIPSAELSTKVNDSFAKTSSQHGEIENCTSSCQGTFMGKLAEDLPRQDSESGHTIPSGDVSEELVVEELKPLANDENVDHANYLQVVEELRQEYETRLNDESVTATVKPTLNNDEIKNTIPTGQAANDPHLAIDLSQPGQETELGTVSNTEVLIEEMKAPKESNIDSVEQDGQKHDKTKLNRKKTKIEEEQSSIKTEMDQKLKKIDEIDQHVLAIDTEVSQMEFEHSESKSRHAHFIELYKFISESQLPLHSHREIRLLMKKMDMAAQEFLSNALDLQFNIESRAKMKLILQEERTELGKLVEAQKLQMQQKLNETVDGMKFEEAVDPDMVSQCKESKLTSNQSCRKRKADYHEEAVEEEHCAPLQAKRMALDAVDTPQECISHGVVTDP